MLLLATAVREPRVTTAEGRRWAGRLRASF
jgi:hypothetical protein